MGVKQSNKMLSGWAGQTDRAIIASLTLQIYANKL
jgi:hypothetical protein